MGILPQDPTKPLGPIAQLRHDEAYQAYMLSFGAQLERRKEYLARHLPPSPPTNCSDEEYGCRPGCVHELWSDRRKREAEARKAEEIGTDAESGEGLGGCSDDDSADDETDSDDNSNSDGSSSDDGSRCDKVKQDCGIDTNRSDPGPPQYGLKRHIEGASR